MSAIPGKITVIRRRAPENTSALSLVGPVEWTSLFHVTQSVWRGRLLILMENSRRLSPGRPSGIGADCRQVVTQCGTIDTEIRPHA